MPRNPPRTADELVLALDLYFEHGWLDDTDPRVIELSSVLNALPHTALDATTFRNPNGVAMKLANFLALDPAYDGVGLTSSGRRDGEVFDAWKDRRADLHRLAESLRAGVATHSLPRAETEAEPEEDLSRPEGAVVLREHRRRERDSSISRARKNEMFTAEGELRCEACDLTEAAARSRFGADLADVFEVHHRVPLSSLIGSRKTRKTDLAVLCPLCHRAIHRLVPMPTVEELRSRLAASVTRPRSSVHLL